MLAFAAVLFLKETEDSAHFTVWNADLLEKMSVAVLERGLEQKKSQECC